jgi:heme-degrading monooxygenase HmoA
MIRVIYKHTLAPGQTEACFAKAWERALRAVTARTPGVLGGSLSRCHAEPTRLIATVEWESLAAWRAFWEGGPPDPEGDPSRAEILEEIRRIDVAQTPQDAGSRETQCEAS